MRITARFWFWIGVAGVLLAGLGAILGWLAFPYAVDLVIGKELALKQNSEAWDRFVNLPLALDMKLSIFNVTNKEEIMKGAKPKLQELGPYVYKQHRHKEDVVYNKDDDTISYHQKLIHYFDYEQSAPFMPNDTVTVINPALMSMLGIMSNIPVLSKGTMFVDAAAPLLFPGGLFITTTADELLFRGVRIPCGHIESETPPATKSQARGFLSEGRIKVGFPQPTPRLAALITCSSFKRIKVPTVTVLPDGDVLFSLFGNKNDTADGLYTVHAGVNHPEELAQITAWNGKHFVDSWGGPTCNAINGTQGDIFSPFITKDTIISVFSTDICRSMALKYMEDTVYRGIPGYRFSPGPEVMASPDENGNNYCFCPQTAKKLTKENGCLKRGAMDLSGCQGIPVIVTYPHFYQADPTYQNGVEGLNPKKELHSMTVDIEPMTGTPLLGGKKMQLNWEVRQVDGVMLTSGVRTTLFPVAWMYEGAQLNTELIDLLNGMLFSKLQILDGLKYGILALGVVMFGAGTSMFFVARRQRPAAVRPETPPPPLATKRESPQGARNGARVGDVGLTAQSGDTDQNTTTTAETKLQVQRSPARAPLSPQGKQENAKRMDLSSATRASSESLA